MGDNIGRYRASVVINYSGYGDPFKLTPVEQHRFCLRETAIQFAKSYVMQSGGRETQVSVVDLSDGFQIGYSHLMYDSLKDRFYSEFKWNPEVKQPYTR